MIHLTNDQRAAATERQHRALLRLRPDHELVDDASFWGNALAGWRADLDSGDFSDGDAGQLHGGIDYAAFQIEANTSELERRVRARAHGYSITPGHREDDLDTRFRAAKAIDCAVLLSAVTGHTGRREGQRTRFACPFHEDVTPSLLCYPPPAGWTCFSCRRGGDAVALLAELNGIGPTEALRLLESGTLGVTP